MSPNTEPPVRTSTTSSSGSPDAATTGFASLLNSLRRTASVTDNPQVAPATHGFAIASLACSLLGALFFPIIGGVLGIVFGAVGLWQIRASHGKFKGDGLAITGILVGVASIILWIIVFSFIIGLLSPARPS